MRLAESLSYRKRATSKSFCNLESNKELDKAI